jgi:hypothetical protein
MTEHTRDLRDCPTAYECRDRLPDLAAWMSDDDLKQLTIWRGPRFHAGRMYFDLDNPARGAFVATGDEQPPKDWTYVAEQDVPREVWTKLVTWQQPVSESQGDSLAATTRSTGAVGP